MFFSKLILPFFAILGFVTVAFATPIATNQLVARDASTDALNELKAFQPEVVSALALIKADILAKVDTTVHLDAFIALLGTSKDSYNSKPSGILVDADVDVFVSVSVDLVLDILAVVNLYSILDLTVFAQIDVALSAWITAIAKVHVDVAVNIGKGIPAIDLNLFVSLKLILTATVLGLVNILGIIGL